MSSVNIENDVHCQFFVTRKKRYCKLTVKEGQTFCGQHKPKPSESIKESTCERDSMRVPCPYDNKHTCYSVHLAKHLTKCNARPLTNLPPYIAAGINLATTSNEECTQTMADMDDFDLLELIERIKLAAQECPEVSERIFEHPAVLEELQRPEYGPNKRKHLLQNSSLLGHMEKSGLLKHKTCFIEFGAGRGQLSYWLGKAMEEDKESMILLVDKASHRHKYDNRQELNVQRIRADIADLNINQIDGIDKYDQIVAASKHLCGAASDMALQCLVNSTKSNRGKPLNITGIIMAFCCHHRCTWNSYTGKEFLLAKGFTAADFHVMNAIVSWATCGTGRSRTWEAASYADAKNKNPTDTVRYLRLNMSQELRKSIGRQCKLLYDYGRFKFLEESGFTCELLHYVNEDVSPENRCLVALKKRIKS